MDRLFLEEKQKSSEPPKQQITSNSVNSPDEFGFVNDFGSNSVVEKQNSEPVSEFSHGENKEEKFETYKEEK
jgi:hypothetical protein